MIPVRDVQFEGRNIEVHHLCCGQAAVVAPTATYSSFETVTAKRLHTSSFLTMMSGGDFI